MVGDVVCTVRTVVDVETFMTVEIGCKNVDVVEDKVSSERAIDEDSWVWLVGTRDAPSEVSNDLVDERGAEIELFEADGIINGWYGTLLIAKHMARGPLLHACDHDINIDSCK